MDTSDTRNGLPPSARRFIGSVTVVGLLVLLAALALVLATGPELGASWVSVLMMLALAVVSIALPVPVHHGGDVQGFNITTGVAVGLIAVAPDPLAVPLVAMAVLLGSWHVTRDPMKTVFNAAQEAIGALAAVVAARVVLGGEVTGDVLSAEVAGALVAAVCTAVLVNEAVMAELFHRLRGDGRLVIFREALGPVTVLALVGDSIVALLIVVLVDRSPVALVLAMPLFAGLLLGYRGLDAANAAGRQATMLHETSRRLLASALDEDAFASAVDGLAEMFRARSTVLVLDGERTGTTLDTTLDQVRSTGRPIHEADGDGALAVPVVVDGRIVGVLAVVGRRGVANWSAADLSLLGTVAGEVGAALRARQLLAAVERERESLAVESQRLGDILHGASDGILLLDGAGRVEACNPAMASTVGLLPEDVLGRRWDDVLRLEEEDGTPVHAADGGAASRAFAGLTGTVAELRLRQADGGWRWLRCSVAPVARDDEVVGVVVVAADLTSQREVEELRGDFLATVSHELRTPLTPLKGFLSMLEAHGPDMPTERLWAIHDSMGNQLARLEDLIGDLLLVAELDGGTPRVIIEEVDLVAVVGEVVAGEAQTPERRARIDVAVPPLRVLADVGALRRALRSLVSNGLKHTDGVMHVSAVRDGHDVVISVRDDGQGIPDQHHATVFEPFRRLGNHLHRTQGPGLGLAIARSLTEALGGSLELAPSREGRGAEFLLRVPHGRVPAARGGRRERSLGVEGTAR